MQMFYVAQNRSQNIYLLPIKSHVNQYQFKNTCVNKLVDIFII
jgi:hypothetical protein